MKNIIADIPMRITAAIIRSNKFPKISRRLRLKMYREYIDGEIFEYLREHGEDIMQSFECKFDKMELSGEDKISLTVYAIKKLRL